MVLIVEGEETTPIVAARSLHNQFTQLCEEIMHIVKLKSHAVELDNLIDSSLD